MLEMWDRTLEQVLNKPAFNVLPELKDQDFKNLLDNVFLSGERFVAQELPIAIKRNGRLENAFVKFVYEPMREADGTISGLMALADEITEQVLARKKIELQALMVHELLMNAPGFVATLVGKDHVYELVNERYQGLIGQRKIQGKTMMEALPELAGQGLDKLMDNVYNTGEPYVGIDMPITLARDENVASEERYFNFSYQPMYDENRNINSVLVFGYEVTDQVISKNKHLENEQFRANELEEKVQQRTLELSKANEDLIKMNQELESFTYVSSHDLQEPLRKIQTFLSYLLQNEYLYLSDNGKDYFQRVNNAVVRMQALIKDLPDYSHAQITDHQFLYTDLDIIIKEVKVEFSEAMLEQSAILEAENIGQADISPFQFRQVINNLIASSLKFSKPGIAPHIIIQSSIVEGSQLQYQNLDKPGGKPPANNAYFHLSVTDNGIGFEPKYKYKIFQVFQRLHSRGKICRHRHRACDRKKNS